MKQFFIIFFALISISCGSSTEDPQTVAELLEKIEGKELTPSEVSELVEKAKIICGLSTNTQIAIWNNLDAKQFEFQDFIFENQCPEQKEFYSQETGRLKQTPR